MTQRNIVILDAPSNLGLRPPVPGAVPGCYKAPWALRDRGLLASLGAADAGALVPPRYLSAWRAGDGDRNADAIARYALALAARLDGLVAPGTLPLVLGGDCSILLGNALALKRRGRYGLVYLDAHSDFRHPGNAPAIGAAGGEALALVTGRGDARLIDLDGRGPYTREDDVAVVGLRDADEYLAELSDLDIAAITGSRLAELGPLEAAAHALAIVTSGTEGFWVHLDADVLDSAEMPAVDSPEPDGPGFATLAVLLGQLLAAPACAGLELTIYDPDLDPDGSCAERLVDCLSRAFGVNDPRRHAKERELGPGAKAPGPRSKASTEARSQPRQRLCFGVPGMYARVIFAFLRGFLQAR